MNILTIFQDVNDYLDPLGGLSVLLGPNALIVIKVGLAGFLALNIARAVMLAIEPVVMLWFAPQDFPRLWDTWTKIIKSIDLLSASFPRSQRVTNALFHWDRERKGLPPVEWQPTSGRLQTEKRGINETQP